MQLRDGIFAGYRAKGISVSSNRYFSIIDPDSMAAGGSGYCGHDDIHEGLIHHIVSNEKSSAWVNRLSSSKNKYVEFRFHQNKVSVQGIAIQTLCAPPNQILFQGSNDEGSTWETVCEKDTPFPTENIVEVICFHHKPFSLFRLSQIGKNTGGGTVSSYKFHIYKFEMYGTNLSSYLQTCIRKRCVAPIVYIILFTQIFTF